MNVWYVDDDYQYHKGTLIEVDNKKVTLELVKSKEVITVHERYISNIDHYYEQLKTIVEYKGQSYDITPYLQWRCKDRFGVKLPNFFIQKIFKAPDLVQIEQKNRLMSVLNHAGEETIVLRSFSFDVILILAGGAIKTMYKYSTSKYAK